MSGFDGALARIRERIAEHELGEHRAAIESSVEKAIGLRTRIPTDADLAIGASRFGGDADVPASFVWPKNDGERVVLIAQLRLADVAFLEGLPKDGLLSFFATTSGWPAWVHHFPEGTPLVRREVTKGDVPGVDVFRAAGVVIEPHLHLPETLHLGDPQAEAIYELIAAEHMAELFPTSQPAIGGQGLVPGTPAVHQLLGSAPSDATYADDEEGAPVGEDMRVLLAFDSDCLVGMEFGDAQRVWLVLDQAALARADFSAIRCAL